MGTMSQARANSSDLGAAHINKITTADLRAALAQGWDDFKALRGDLVFVGLIYVAVGVFAVFIAQHYSLLPILFPLIAGLSLLGPAVATGFYELAKHREKGDRNWRHFFDVFKSQSLGSIFGLTLVLAIWFALWIAAATMIYSATLASEAPHSIGAFLRDVFTTPQGWTMMLLGNLVGLFFAAVALMIGFVSFPMLIDRPVGMSIALDTSIRAAMRNPLQTALWGLIVVVMLVLGSIPLFVGLAVVLPVLGYATWHLYRRIVDTGAPA